MDNKTFKEKLLPELDTVEKAIRLLIPKHIENEDIKKSLYEHYSAAIFYEEEQIGSFKDNTPELVKAILRIGFELAKERSKK